MLIVTKRKKLLVLLILLYYHLKPIRRLYRNILDIDIHATHKHITLG